MASRRPLVRVSGSITQLPAGDIVDPTYLSANLAALAGLTGAANQGVYFTAAGSMAVYDLTVFGRLLGGSADAAAARTTLGLGTAATYNVSTTPAASTLPLRDSSNYLTLGRVVADFTINKINTANAGGRIHMEVADSATISPTNRRVSLDVSANRFRVYEGGDTARGVYIDIDACAASAATNLTPQTGADDTTAGRLLRIGGLGIGGAGLLVTDFDAITAGGKYYGAGATGTPVASVNVTVDHSQINANQAMQIASVPTTGALYWRVKYAAAWSAWKQVNYTPNKALTDFIAGRYDGTMRTYLPEEKVFVASLTVGGVTTAVSTAYSGHLMEGSGWNVSAAGTSAGATRATANAATMALGTGTTATGLCYVRNAAPARWPQELNLNYSLSQITFAGCAAHASVGIPTLSAAAQEFALSINLGFVSPSVIIAAGTALTTPVMHMVYNRLVSTNWLIGYANASGTYTLLDTGVAVDTNQKLISSSMTRNAAGNFELVVKIVNENGNYGTESTFTITSLYANSATWKAASLTTNFLDYATTDRVYIAKSVGTTSRTVNVKSVGFALSM
jgi:hypothetical protein